MVKIPNHKELRSWLIDGEIERNPHDVPGFIDELSGFIVQIPEPDVTREIEVRKRIGFPIWNEREQICKLLEIVTGVYGYVFSENVIDQLTAYASYYSRAESLCIPEDTERKDICRTSKRNFLCNS